MADRRTVLIADGTPRTRPQGETALRDSGCEVVTASDANFVLTLAMRHEPAVILLGAYLPAGGALKALRRLRACVHTAAIPVVALTAPGAEKQALLSAGADACLEPPVTNAEVVAAVQRQMGTMRTVTDAPSQVLSDPGRLSALAATGLLDTDPDEALDVVTRLAASVLAVPVALVSLVDDRRQFFKSQVGLPAPWDSRRETPLSHSFCQWVVSSQDELVIADARAHPVLHKNRAVTDLGVIAYAGVPLASVEGHRIGSFCAIDGRVRQWTDHDLAALRAFAQLADAQAALSLPDASGLEWGARELWSLEITQAAARGYLGAAYLLKRSHPPLDARQRRDLLAIVERHSHQLIEFAAAAPPRSLADHAYVS